MGQKRGMEDAFNDVSKYSQKYKRQKRRAPKIDARPYVKEFFPGELWETLGVEVVDGGKGGKNGAAGKGGGQAAAGTGGAKKLGFSALDAIGGFDDLEEEDEGEGGEGGEGPMKKKSVLTGLVGDDTAEDDDDDEAGEEEEEIEDDFGDDEEVGPIQFFGEQEELIIWLRATIMPRCISMTGIMTAEMTGEMKAAEKTTTNMLFTRNSLYYYSG